MSKKIIMIVSILIVCIGAGFLVVGKLNKTVPVVRIGSQALTANPDKNSRQNQGEPSSSDAGGNQPAQKTPQPSATISRKIEQKIPFVVQAPFGNWSDPIFQNACEEAGVVMAMGWVNDIAEISASDAQSQILKIVDFENKTFGYNTDTDIYDMRIIFQKYFDYQNIALQENISLPDIKNELQKGNIVLVPAFGQALGNPNYTAPGPVVHMLVIIGYDPATKEFITNDTGTKRGSGYRYDENVLFGAIWEYPSGPVVPKAPAGKLKKGMIVIQPR